MLLGWDQARPPDPPHNVSIDVTGTNFVSIKIQEPNEGSLGTKFKGKLDFFLYLLIFVDC